MRRLKLRLASKDGLVARIVGSVPILFQRLGVNRPDLAIHLSRPDYSDPVIEMDLRFPKSWSPEERRWYKRELIVFGHGLMNMMMSETE